MLKKKIILITVHQFEYKEALCSGLPTVFFHFIERICSRQIVSTVLITIHYKKSNVPDVH